MRFYWPIAKADAEQRMVWGYASTEAADDQGETVTRQALGAALEDYMRFANIREMHQPSAVGVATEAAVDDKGLYLGAKIVDADAWRKVVEGVYKGFSIGGRVTARDVGDRRLITAVQLTEISLVDRPANPEAVFDCWKRSSVPAATDGPAGPPLAAAQPARPIAMAEKNLTAADAVAQIIADLEAVHDRISTAAPIDAEGLSLSSQLQDVIAELHNLLAALAPEIGGAPAGRAASPLPKIVEAMAVGSALRKAQPVDAAPFAGQLVKLAGELLPRLDALQKRVDEIARTPLPPQTIARGFVGIAKGEDTGRTGMAAADIVVALARMSEEERTLTLIKAAHASPIVPFARPPGPAR